MMGAASRGSYYGGASGNPLRVMGSVNKSALGSSRKGSIQSRI